MNKDGESLATRIATTHQLRPVYPYGHSVKALLQHSHESVATWSTNLSLPATSSTLSPTSKPSNSAIVNVTSSPEPMAIPSIFTEVVESLHKSGFWEVFRALSHDILILLASDPFRCFVPPRKLRGQTEKQTSCDPRMHQCL